MGLKSDIKLFYVVICLIISAYFIHFRSPAAVISPKPPLRLVFDNVGAWKGIYDDSLEPSVIQALDFDDYIFRAYQRSSNTITLYIGYYRTNSKIGAAHVPLVCFPGRGWELTLPNSLSISTKSGIVNLEFFVAKKGLKKELLLYWFQSYRKTSRGTFIQKINNSISKLRSFPEDNAFVRVSLPIESNSVADAQEEAIAFIKAFYPEFFSYIIS